MAVWLYTVTRNRCWRMRRKPAHAPANVLSLDELMPDNEELGDCWRMPRRPGRQRPRRRAAPTAASGDSARPAGLAHRSRAPRYGRVDHRAGCAGSRTSTGNGSDSASSARLSVRKMMNNSLVEFLKICMMPNLREKRKTAKAKNRQRPAECRDLFANLSEYLTAEWNRLPANRCANISSMPVLRDISARPARRHRSLPLLEIPCDPAVAPRLRAILTRNTCVCWLYPSKRNIRDSVTNRRSRAFLLVEGENHDGSEDHAS